MRDMRFIGLDVHKETIAIGVAEGDGSTRSMGVIPNRVESVRKLIKRLGGPKKLTVCYAGVPTRPGDRVKTDRRDAVKLARSYRAGDLTPVWVPTPEHEALRDLVRVREAGKKD